MDNIFSRPGGRMGKFAIYFLLALGMCLLGAIPGRAAGRQVLHSHWPSAVAHMTPLRHLPSSQHLSLALSLPLRNQQALTDFLRQLSDPSSPNFRHYLTPAQFAERFGPTDSDYQAVIEFARARGLKVTGTYSNRMILDVDGAVPDIESAFHVTMSSYQHPTEARQFYAPNAEPSVDFTVPLWGSAAWTTTRCRIRGSSLKPLWPSRGPGSHLQLQRPLCASLRRANTGSAPNGDYMGNDFRTAYAPGVTLTGAGQSVGLLQFDGYTASDITYYESLAGRSNITLTNVLLDGFTGAPTGNGGEVEVSLDIEMAMSMAPGISNIIVYEAGPYGNWHDILNRMATDNLAKQLSCSWYIPEWRIRSDCRPDFPTDGGPRAVLLQRIG